MLKFLVLLSDVRPPKRGAHGCPLTQFLRVFHEDHEVSAVTPAQLNPNRPIDADVLLIGVPTKLNKEQLRGVRYRQAVLFDYEDDAGPAWQNSDESLLRSVSDLYLRSFVDRSRDFGLRMGTLPLYRKPKLAICLRALELRKRLFGPPTRSHDACFIGSPSRLLKWNDGRPAFYDQRVEWLLELTGPDSPFSFFGGLAPSRREVRQLVELEEKYGDLSRIMWAKRRVNFFSYFHHMCQSRVMLVPGGYSRWTFRHYEAIYAGAAVVSTDFRDCELLVPLPEGSLIIAPDHEPVLPAVAQAVELQRSDPERFEAHVRHLETFFDYGHYSRRKPAVLERFLAQLAPTHDARRTAPPSYAPAA